MDSAELLMWSFYSPVVSLPVLLLLFALGHKLKQRRSVGTHFMSFTLVTLLGATIATLPAVAWVFIESARANSGNGPALLVFVGPGAASLGAVIAALSWCFGVTLPGLER